MEVQNFLMDHFLDLHSFLELVSVGTVAVVAVAVMTAVAMVVVVMMVHEIGVKGVMDVPDVVGNCCLSVQILDWGQYC